MMEHFFIITNKLKDPELAVTNRIRGYLERQGKSCGVQIRGERNAGRITYSDSETRLREIPPDTDCVLVLGGDGTLLQAARDLVDFKIPILGVNMGSLGYLAEVEENGVEEALHHLLTGRYQVEQRMMLTGRMKPDPANRVKRQEYSSSGEYALNDIVIIRCGPMQAIHFNIYVNGQFLNSYHADGIIVSTPTGSTGYNLSAGGPIVEPKAELMVLSPICPHTLNTRSIILSSMDCITVEVTWGRDGEMQRVEANFDGSHTISMVSGDRMEVRKADKTMGFVKLNQVSFLEVLHRKMSEQT